MDIIINLFLEETIAGFGTCLNGTVDKITWKRLTIQAHVSLVFLGPFTVPTTHYHTRNYI